MGVGLGSIATLLCRQTLCYIGSFDVFLAMLSQLLQLCTAYPVCFLV